MNENNFKAFDKVLVRDGKKRMDVRLLFAL